MNETQRVSISVVIAAYQAERWIAQALDSILAQTRPADEIVVVDDGSRDGTPDVLDSYCDRVRVIRQENRGAPAAFNRAIRESGGDFIALCGSDDVWESQKLEWQQQAIAAHPDVDVLFGHAKVFGVAERDHARPPAGMTGALETSAMRDALFAENFICAPSVLIRRTLFERLGPFVEGIGTEDYEYWFRCLRGGARFYYDPRALLGWRQHGGNQSANQLRMDEFTARVRLQYAADVGDRSMAREVIAATLFRTARAMVDAGRPAEARATFWRSLRYASPGRAWDALRALVWTAVLWLPTGPRARLGAALVRARRAATR
jgi:glycosyltransferase involved in cell wall biosynthesis